MINYEAQQSANLLAFYTDADLKEKKAVLQALIRETNRDNVVWALSCSGSFFFRGIMDDFNDFDIVVEESSIDGFVEIFERIGGVWEEKQNGKERYFDSRFFKSGKIGTVEFDVISVFTVTTYNTRYSYFFKKEDIEFVKDVPICPVEAAMLLYGMMIGWQAKRRYKYDLAMEYLKKRGISYPEILNPTDGLPKFIREDVKKILK